jgi:hypothetical protein
MTLTHLPPANRALIAAAINRFGSGQHPAADPESLDYFTRSYAAACVHVAMSTKSKPALNEDGRALALDTLHRLGRAQMSAAEIQRFVRS